MTEQHFPDPDDVNVVRSFLERFYAGQWLEDEGTVAALRALKYDGRARWKVAKAMHRLLAASPQPDLYLQLAAGAADRDIYEDESARAFLERVFAGNDFDAAVNPDNVEEDLDD